MSLEAGMVNKDIEDSKYSSYVTLANDIVLYYNGEGIFQLLDCAGTRPSPLQVLQLPLRPRQYPPHHLEKLFVTGASQYVTLISAKTGEV